MPMRHVNRNWRFCAIMFPAIFLQLPLRDRFKDFGWSNFISNAAAALTIFVSALVLLWVLDRIWPAEPNGS